MVNQHIQTLKVTRPLLLFQKPRELKFAAFNKIRK